MKKPHMKYHSLTGLALIILGWVVYVQILDMAWPIRIASANQAITSSSMQLTSEKLDLVAFSPDGNTLASAASDGQIIVWDVFTGQERLTLPSSSASPVSGIVFSPDGNTLASVSGSSIHLTDTISGEARLLLPQSAAVTYLAFSPDGKTLASVGQDGRITLLNSQSGAISQVLTGHQSGVNAIAFSPDSTILASGGQDAQIKLWDMAAGQEQASLPGEGGAITHLAFSPDGKTVAGVSQDARITVLDSQSGAISQVLTGHQSGVNAIAFSPDSTILASGGQDAQIKLWDAATGLEQASLPGEGGVAVTHLAFSPDGKSLASIGEGETVFLWDVSTKLPQLLTGHRDWVDKIVFSSNQKTLASVGKTGQVVVWDLATGVSQQSFQIPAMQGVSSAGVQAPLSGSAVSNTSLQSTASNTPVVADNTTASTVSSQAASANNTVARKKRSAQKWKGVKALAISQDGTEMGAAGEDGVIRIFKKNGTLRWKLSGHHGMAITGMAFRGKTKDWISAGRDTELKTWNDTGKNLKTFYGPEHPPRAVAVSPDGRYIAIAGEETRVFLFDAIAGKLSRIFSGHIDFINGLAFSPDGRYLASAGAEGRTLMWDMNTGKRLHTLLGHAGEVNAVAFSPDGTLLATASEDSTVILWNVTTGLQIKALAGHQGSVRSVAFSPNGNKLVSAGEDSRMLVWDPKTGQLKKQLTGPAAAINVLVFDPAGKLHAASENSEISEFDTDTGTKVQSIAVPVTNTAEPQAALSETLYLATGNTDPALMTSTHSRSIQNESIGSSHTAFSSIIDQLIDWMIPAANAATLPDPNQGPGGPILVITNTADPFGKYYAEILRTEGLNEFAVTDISTVNATTLTAYDVVLLSRMTLSPAQVTMFTNWVTAGGNLIAMRPDAQLAGLLGVTATGTTLSNGYLLVDTSGAPGNGIVNQTIQFHGGADRYTVNSASSLATLYTNATTPTANPAVTLRSVGASGGQAAAFTYDLASSIVYTRQGNPAWATQERDGFTPIRSDDKFFGNATGDPQTDWVDFNNIAIPQADEQQRLLANLILEMNRDRKPLPRFWYFPYGKKAVVIMTGDDHGNNGTAGRFNQFINSSTTGCSVANWECIRGTSYIYPNTPLTDAQAASFTAQGFEVGLHVNTNCGDFTRASLRTFYTDQIGAIGQTGSFKDNFPSIPAPLTQRHHCIAWSDWVSGAIVQLENGIRFDTSYYFWPPSWVQDRPGFFSGSGMPMRFTDEQGAMIDVYHAVSQMTDESGQTYPLTIDTLLDRAFTEGYYGAFTINAHTDVATIPESDAVIASVLNTSHPERGIVPIVSSKQMLDWLDSRNSSSFGSLTWSGNTLSFTVTPGTSGGSVPDHGLQVLLPVQSSVGVLTGLTRNGVTANFTTTTIKGVNYATFPGDAGNYAGVYSADTTAPTLTSKSPALGATGVSVGAAITATFSEAINPATINATTFELRDSSNTLISATVSYNPGTQTATLTPTNSLAASATYTATVKGGTTDPRVKDLTGNALAANEVWSFTTGAQPCSSSSCSAWSSSTIPGTPSVNDPGSVELGVKFRSDLDGFITGIRFYQANAGAYTGTLWNTAGQQLATGNVTSTAAGWQQATFTTPVAITANTVYVASYHAAAGNYAATNSPQFSTSGVDNAPIHLLQDGVSGGNGLYAYSASSTFPANTFNSSNYWVDVAFTTSTAPDTTPPTVTAQSPVSGATGIATTAAITAIFSESMDAASITTASFELRGPAPTNTLVSATVAYNASTRTATLTPTAALSNSTAYTVTVKGGALDPRVKDAAGNAMTANSTWTFTTAGSGVTGCSGVTESIWPTNPTPATLSDPDTSAVELGLKFRSNVNGLICGIRFYKGPNNTGTHTGSLWNSGGGSPLATVTFTNETASGWQQANFTNPVAITAGTVYVVSYQAPVGRYSVNDSYFASGVTSGSLFALSSAESGGNGVYLYGSGGFPTNTFQSANYWVDVLFTANTGPDTTPPTVNSTLPAAGATGVIPTNPVSVTFSEAMTASTINSTTFELRNPPPANSLVPATVTYNAGTNTATLTPTNPLTASTTYTAKIIGGVSGVKDAAATPNPLAADYMWSFTTGINPCSPGGNPIICENSKAGNPSTDWDISGAGDSSLQGFATDISVNKGDAVTFKINVNTPSTANYRLDIYRMGYYNNDGARLVATVQPLSSTAQTQPACLTHAATGLIDCGNWADSASWPVPADAVSGIYFAKVIRQDGANAGKASHIVFIVRDDASTSDILFQTSDTTWQAYNNYGGNSLYTGTGPGTGGNAVGRAYKVSYNRPFNTRTVDNGQDWVFNAEYPMVRWLEANGYNVSYFTGIDSDRFGALIRQHKLFLSNAHDEYWSGQQRANVETARDLSVNPVNLAFFSGNEVFWKTRWENNIINTSGALGTNSYRTLVCYKETHNYPNNPDPTNIWTGTWRDPRGTPPADGGRPENALKGPIFMVNDGATTSIEVPQADGQMRFWRSTGIATLPAGSFATLPNGTLGYEWDVDLDNGFRPDGLVRLSTTIVPNAPVLTDNGSTFGSGTANHALTLYKAGTGAIVFGAGTVQWAWGLDSNHDRAGTPVNASMQQATVNLFADMGIQPGTIQPGLVAATASTDLTRPASAITSPLTGATLTPGSAVTISGTATDVGGRVGGMEVSVDGGATWHAASGRNTWTYNWTAPGTPATVLIKSRAVDDSLNLEVAGAGVSVNVGSGSDTTSPIVTMTAPVNGATVTGATVPVSANASDNVGVTSVQFLLDGAALGSPDTAAPYSITWNSTAASNGVHTLSARAGDAAGNLTTATGVSVTVSNSVVTNTGLLNSAANAAVANILTPSNLNGDGNGFEINPANGYSNDSVFAVDTNSGTNTSTSCTDSGKDKHIYFNYGINLPATAAINGIEVRLDARADATAGAPKMCVQLSWDGGTNWTTAKTTATLTTTEASYILGGTADVWGRTWAVSNFSNANFRVRIINVASNISRDFSLDWVAVRVTYQ
ncbi:MAG: DUF4082 domain-containing protein [Methylobacter sp.]|nr:DUF4082 domain-containing protein [Methylobacter sp.]